MNGLTEIYWSARLIVVAPDSDLRRSLEFALQAEGYDVRSLSDPSDPILHRRDFDCVVADHHSLARVEDAGAEFCRRFAPVILLANQIPHELSPWAYQTVLKPFLGAALSDAVRDALRSAAGPK